MKAHVLPLPAKLRTLLRVAVVTDAIIGNELERRALVTVMVQGVVVHAHVAGAVAEGEYRLPADLPGDLLNLACFNILYQQLLCTYIAVEQHEDTGDNKAAEISALASLLLVQVSTTA